MTLKLNSDLREDPRYPVTDVIVEVSGEGPSLSARVADISLNGALLDFADSPEVKPGDGLQLRFRQGEVRSFSASARCVHVRDRRMGVEFLAFEAVDFESLTDLVGELRRARVAHLLATRQGRAV
ncbi:MAG: PilZ domain-containing protein [Xanthomonadales bacterium]|nr:PilZ domain-containing protein [Xanthomonadales bacterium]MCB1633045.1 PilZ domain-containing protein [Xanthomonadales bacterium]MCB1641250.1 PilZ domain-containing protein [Xanthomonadales bacterium]